MFLSVQSPRPETETEHASAVDGLAALARSATAGNAQATRTLIVSVTPAVLKTVRGVLGPHHAEVEDTTQDSVWRFVSSLGGFRYECSVLHFACRIAVHTALNVRRRNRPQAGRVDELVPDQLPSSDPSPADALGAVARRRVLRDLFATLPDAQAEAFVMHIVLGMTVEETAETCDVPANTVRSRLRLAKQALRERAGAHPAFADILKEGDE